MSKLRRAGQIILVVWVLLGSVLLVLLAIGELDPLYYYSNPEEAITGAQVGKELVLVHYTIHDRDRVLTTIECQKKSNDLTECIWKPVNPSSNAQVIIRTKKGLPTQDNLYLVKVLERRENLLITEYDKILPPPSS